ncbi:hypothetical protein [Erythrobacter sp.]|uniref:hypothetical protein n=1 Tax=Erythrobacter sp. TaxID=1042 RepID=UPI00311FB46E
MSEIDQNLADYENAAQIAQTDFSHLTEADFDLVEYDDEGAAYGMVQGVPVAINQQSTDQYITGSIKKPDAGPQGSISRDVGRGLTRGAIGAGEAMNQALPLLGKPVDWLNDGLRYIGVPVSDSPVGGSESIRGAVQSLVDFGRNLVPDSVNQATAEYISEQPQNPLVQTIVEEIGKFGLQAVTPAMYLRAFSAMTPFARGIAWGGIADFINAKPDQNDPTIVATLVDGLSSMGGEERSAVSEAVVTALTKNQDDPEIINRAREALDGMVLGGAIEKAVPFIVRAAKVVAYGSAGAAVSMQPDEAQGGPLTAILRAFSRAENEALKKVAGSPQQLRDIKNRAAEIKAQYPANEGWAPIEVTNAKIKDSGKIEINWRQPAYGFEKPPAGVTPEQHLSNMSETMVRDVGDVVQRAASGDAAAQEIVRQARWYRDMRSRLRTEFGGLGDVFADLLGATSAQTGVEQNWRNSIEILRRYSRGEYDKEIQLYTDRMASGERMDPKTLQQLDKAGEFELIRSAAGALFNTNSPAATAALLDMFRQVKQGAAPKTINFTGNLIGYSSDATIDVWAARYLREAAGLPRIPPPAEKAVGGKHAVGSTFEEPKITGEFAFGQKVFANAAEQINNSGLIKGYDESLGDLGPDDLQALVWFIEKEKWTKAGWTSKAGEGGSLDYEASLAGAADPEAVLEARRAATATFKPPNKRKTETDAEYEARLSEARATFDADVAAAQAQLQDMAAPLDRTLLGVSRERPGAVPTNVQQAELAGELMSPVKNDRSVIGYQANNTYGEFMGQLERALNAEFVTRSDFDPTALTRQLVESGKKYDQDAVFISKVLRAPTEQSRPGVEIYFNRREGVDMAQKITAMLREKGVDGFTFVTDARQMDRVDVQAAGDAATAGLTGIRFQYIPEFDSAYDAARHAEIVAEKENLFERILDDIYSVPGIAQADVVHYDTKVFRRATGTDWMTGGESYDDFLRTSSRGSNRPQGTGAANSRPTPPDSSP